MDTKIIEKKKICCFSLILIAIQLVSLEAKPQGKMFRQISIKNEGYNYIFYVGYVKDNIKPDEHLKYFWYDKGKVYSNFGGYSGQLLQGTL